MNKKRTSLSKLSSKILTTLSAQGKTIFTIADALEITKTNNAQTRWLLNDLVKKKWLIRLVSGRYLIVPLSAGEEAEYSENWYVVAKNLIEPKNYYISHYGALDIHEMLVHPLMTIYISSPTRRIPKKILGATFRFVYTQPKDIWGIEEDWITSSQKVKVSDLERTIIDCLNRPDLAGGISEIAKGIWTKRNDIDYQKLLKYTKKLGRKSVAKRLGFILENYKIGEDILPKLKNLVTARYQLLDPTLPETGKHISSWKLRVNIEPEELLAITQT